MQLEALDLIHTMATNTGLTSPSVPLRGIQMRVISRRENEAVVIDQHIVVTVLEIQVDCVRIAIESPFDEPSYREEVIHLEPEFVH